MIRSFPAVTAGCGGNVSEEKKDTGIICGSIGTISQKNENEMLRLSEDKFTRFVKWSWDGILLTSESGSLVEWNPAMEQITGLPRSEVLGKKLWEVNFSLLPAEKRTPELFEHLKNLVLSPIETGQSAGLERSIEYEIQCPDNKIRIIESFMFTIPVRNTFMAGAILRDITGRKRSERAVQEAIRKLNLLSGITRHDINNQLTIFNGYLTLLELGTPAMKSGDIIRILQGATSKIQRILNFTKEYQEVGVKFPAWQDLGETIRSAKKTVEVSMVRFSPGQASNGIEIYTDPMLVRVFSNLIDNSIRHGERVSEIRIHSTGEEHRLVMAYEDDGIGISDKIRPVLFERGKGKNTGYGMFLVREILAITGFTLAETGESGKGVRFEILVPEGSFRMADKKSQL